MVFAPKYRGKMLVGDVAMICEGIICKTCVEMDIEIIEIAVNPDHVHIFFKYPPKYSLSYIAKRIKGSTSRILRKEFHHLREWCGEHFWAPSCFHGLLQFYIPHVLWTVNTESCRSHYFCAPFCR
jgi:putative transposase